MTAVLSDVRRDLVPTGRLRTAINRGNTVLVQMESANSQPRGVTVDLAREVARRLQVDIDFIIYDAAGKVFEAIKRNEWDIAFLAIDPVRAMEMEFTTPYVTIEGVYVVRADSKIEMLSDVDRPNIGISVTRGSAYDLFLSRTVKKATLIRSPTATDALDLFMTDGSEVLAGIRQSLLGLIKERPDLRMIEPPFMAIPHAMGTPKGRSTAASFLNSFIVDVEASGFVAAALKRAESSRT
jgi:polar amino acid transport system substrate-binding protein